VAEPFPVIERPVLTGYGDGGFRVSGKFLTGSILVNRERLLPWENASSASFLLEDVAAILVTTPPVELLLIGGGARLRPVDAVLRAALRQRGVAVEPMDTGAACRTYNALLGEGRRVAAALLAVS
jgi:uncharacterized protein